MLDTSYAWCCLVVVVKINQMVIVHGVQLWCYHVCVQRLAVFHVVRDVVNFGEAHEDVHANGFVTPRQRVPGVGVSTPPGAPRAVLTSNQVSDGLISKGVPRTSCTVQC